MSDADDVPLLIEVTTDGTVRAYAISILEDLWHDYLYFKEQAELATTKGALLLHKRYLRASCLTITSYLEGIVNRWCTILLLNESKSQSQIDRYIKDKSLFAKCRFLTAEASKQRSLIQEPSLAKIKELRNELVHLKTDKDQEIFWSLQLSNLTEAEKNITEWLDSIEKSLSVKRHPNTESALNFLDKIGTVKHEE